MLRGGNRMESKWRRMKVFLFFQEDGEWKSMEEISDSGNGEKYANVHRNKNKTKG